MGESMDQSGLRSGVGAEVVAVNWYTDAAGCLNFVGVVRNSGTVALEFVMMEVTLLDADGFPVATMDAYTELDVLEPGQKSPFYIFFADEIDAWVDYELAVEGSEALTLAPYTNLKVVAHSGSPTESAKYVIEGEVKNTGSETVTFIDVSAALYDAGGALVGVAFVFVSEPVGPGDTAQFQILAAATAGDVDHYELFVQGQAD
jgi:hypothetical protein